MKIRSRSMIGMTIMLSFAIWCMYSTVLVSAQSIPDQYLQPHNSARRILNTGIPDLRWDTTLESYAKSWAANQARNANCKLQHSGGPYGENIYWASWKSTPADAVKAWLDEKQYYNYASNSCAAGKVCGHYTQVVWKNSLNLGCGSASCANGGTFVVCSYNQPGKYVGQRPY